MITERQFPYIRPAKGRDGPKRPYNPMKGLSAKQRVLRMAGYKKPVAVTLPKVNLPE